MLEVEDSLAAYCLDGAVVTMGTVVENALLERIKVGSGATLRSVPRYTLKQLLSDDFTLPRPRDEDGADGSAVDGEVYDEVR